MNTYAALIKVMKMYRDEPTFLHPKEFIILVNYYHYLHEQCQEVDTWNHLKWYEYYENLYAAIQSHPLKKVTWKCPNQYCNGPEGDWKNVQKLCPYCLQVHWLVLSGWLIIMHPRCSVMCLPSRVLQRLEMQNG
jgi:hypothetical protein